MDSITKALTNLAFTKDEVVVYLALLEEGAQSVSALAKMLSMHRPKVYEVVDALLLKTFVEKKKHGARTIYTAAAPYVLLEKAQSVRNELAEIVPKLQKLKEKKEQKFSIQQYEGEEGLSFCFMDVVQTLSKESIFYRLSSAHDQQYVDSLVPKEYRPMRDAKKLERRVITSRYVGSQKKPSLDRSIRYIDETDELFEHNVIQFIYADKVALLDFSTLTAVVIKNKAIADFQKSIFLTLYKKLPAT